MLYLSGFACLLVPTVDMGVMDFAFRAILLKNVEYCAIIYDINTCIEKLQQKNIQSLQFIRLIIRELRFELKTYLLTDGCDVELAAGDELPHQRSY